MKVYTDKGYCVEQYRRRMAIGSIGSIHTASVGEQIHSGFVASTYSYQMLGNYMYVPEGYRARLIDPGSPARPACWELIAIKV